MELKTIFAQDSSGNVLPMSTCYLYVQGTQTLASGLQDAAGAALTNPWTTDARGLVQFAAPDGIYDLRVINGSKSYQMRVQCNDVREAARIADLADKASPSKGAGMSGFSHSVNYPAGTLGAHARNFVSVKDAPFNAKGDGVTNDTSAIQAAIDFVYANGGGLVYVPAGIYSVSQTALTLPVVLASSDGTQNNTNTSTQACIVVRTGVTLMGAGFGCTTMRAATGLQRNVITLYNISYGGVIGMKIEGVRASELTSVISMLT